MLRYRVLLLSFLTLLSACNTQPQIETDVTRFHHADLQVGDKTFVIQPDADQKKSLEFEHYAKIVSSELTQLGMRQVSVPPANFGVTFHYRVGDGKTTIIDSDPYHADIGFGTGYGWGGSGYGWGVSAPLYPYPRSSQPEHITTYPHRFSLQLLDLKARNSPVVFEGTVTSEQSHKGFTTTGRCLIQALFVQFPGVDGETTAISLPTNRCLATGSPTP
jgi:hypothetical protein